MNAIRTATMRTVQTDIDRRLMPQSPDRSRLCGQNRNARPWTKAMRIGMVRRAFRIACASNHETALNKIAG